MASPARARPAADDAASREFASCRGSSTCRASRGSSTATSTTKAARSSSTSRRWIRTTARLVYNVDYAAMRYLGAGVARSRSARHRGVGLRRLSCATRRARASGRSSGCSSRTCGSSARCSARASSHQSLAPSRAAPAASERLARGSRAGGLPLDTARGDRSTRARAADRELAPARSPARARPLGRRLVGAAVRDRARAVVLPLVWAAIASTVAVGGRRSCTRAARQSPRDVAAADASRAGRLRRLTSTRRSSCSATRTIRAGSRCRGGGLYVNSGTWLPATRPGLRRSFTHVRIQPRTGARAGCELRQWRDGASLAFVAKSTRISARRT